MKLDSIIQALLPHDEKFYSFFEEVSDLLVNATQLYKKIPNANRIERENICREIEALEHQADNVTHSTMSELSASFVTPFDREDIHLLASSLDDVMDFIEGSSKRFILYEIDECPREITELIYILDLCTIEIQKGVKMLRDFRRPESLKQVIHKINDYENQADAIFNSAMKNLMQNNNDVLDVLLILKLKEIFFGLETATDKCEDVANIFETLLIKHN